MSQPLKRAVHAERERISDVTRCTGPGLPDVAQGVEEPLHQAVRAKSDRISNISPCAGLPHVALEVESTLEREMHVAGSALVMLPKARAQAVSYTRLLLHALVLLNPAHMDPHVRNLLRIQGTWDPHGRNILRIRGT